MVDLLEFMIDKQFVIFDRNNNPIQLDTNIAKLIYSQLGHELIHSAARYDGYSGILSNRNNTGLNEGLTQMITEKIFGYTVSPNSDNYKDYKKIAKIFDITFGENVILDTYFNHTDNLEQHCNRLTGNPNFYRELNDVLTSMYTINPKTSTKDSYYKSLAQPVYDRMNQLIFQKVCINIVVPKLKALSKEKQTKYINDILTAMEDDSEIRRQIHDNIINFYNMDNEQLTEQSSRIEKQLVNIQQQKEFIDELYKGVRCKDLVIIDDDGTIHLKSNPNIKIVDERLQEKILSRIYFQENKYAVTPFEDNVAECCENLDVDDNNLVQFEKNSTLLNRKQLLSIIKVAARNRGYIVLNSLSECESGQDIRVRAMRIPDDTHPVSFEDLKHIYENYTVDYDENWQMFVVDRTSGEKVNDVDISNLAKFASVWGASAGIKCLANEKIPGESCAFNEPSERIYYKLSQLINESLTETGTIDTKNIYNQISNDIYKHSEEIIRTLFHNSASLQIIYDFYKMQNSRAKLETELAETSSEFVMGISDSAYVAFQTQEIVKRISVQDINSRCISEGIRSSETINAYKQTQLNMGQQEKGLSQENINYGGNR